MGVEQSDSVRFGKPNHEPPHQLPPPLFTLKLEKKKSCEYLILITLFSHFACSFYFCACGVSRQICLTDWLTERNCNRNTASANGRRSSRFIDGKNDNKYFFIETEAEERNPVKMNLKIVTTLFLIQIFVKATFCKHLQVSLLCFLSLSFVIVLDFVTGFLMLGFRLTLTVS